MIEVTATVRKWGRSKGVVIPSPASGKLKTGKKVKLLIVESEGSPFKETFGIAKFSKPTEQILREAEKGAWDE